MMEFCLKKSTYYSIPTIQVFCKEKNMETVKNYVFATDWQKRWMNMWNTKNIKVSQNNQCDPTIVDIYHRYLSKPTECTIQSMNSTVNYTLWVIM